MSPPIHFEFDSAMQAIVPYDSGLETAFTVVHSGIFGFGDFLILRFEDGVQLRMLYMQRSHDRSAAVAGPLLKAQTTLQCMPTHGLHRKCSGGERRATSASWITRTSSYMMDVGGSRLPRGLARPPDGVQIVPWGVDVFVSPSLQRAVVGSYQSSSESLDNLESFVDWMRLALGKRELPEQFRIAC